MKGSRKENNFGRVPDENYAREVMQLFSIGLLEMNVDGSLKTSDGKPIDTYSLQDIKQLARVFTGWDQDGGNDGGDYTYVTRPMVQAANRIGGSYFSTGDKLVLGTNISTADPAAALSQAMDLLANHPNVGPFIGRQLIQRFTMSNPSSAYVGRVAAVFNDNGRGERGDLKATLRAVLLDPEARAEPSGNASGRLREPVQRFIQWGRTFGLSSASGAWSIGDTSDASDALSQSPWRSPGVFNFFRPGYVPPGNELAANQITAPEFQLINESSVASYLNFMQSAIANGFNGGDIVADYKKELELASDAPTLLSHLNLYLAADAIGAETLSVIATALNSIDATTDQGRLNRVRAAIMLVMASPEYLIQK